MISITWWVCLFILEVFCWTCESGTSKMEDYKTLWSTHNGISLYYLILYSIFIFLYIFGVCDNIYSHLFCLTFLVNKILSRKNAHAWLDSVHFILVSMPKFDNHLFVCICTNQCGKHRDNPGDINDAVVDHNDDDRDAFNHEPLQHNQPIERRTGRDPGNRHGPDRHQHRWKWWI